MSQGFFCCPGFSGKRHEFREILHEYFPKVVEYFSKLVEYFHKQTSHTPMIAGIAFVQRCFATGGVSWRRPVNLPCHLPSTEKLYDLRHLWSFLISRHLINLYNQRYLWSFLSSTGGLGEVSGETSRA